MILVRHLIWEAENVAHIAQHNITPNEVAQVCNGDYLIYSSYKGRFVIVGATSKNRLLSIILDPEPEEGIYYPVTAYDASRKDRQLYQQVKGEEVKQNDRTKTKFQPV